MRHAKTILISALALFSLVGNVKSQAPTKQAAHEEEINRALKDPKVSEYHKITYKRGSFLYTFDLSVLKATTDSLFTHDPEKDLFYFVVFTHSLNGSDNEYPQHAADAAYRYVTTRTPEFVEFFAHAPGLTDQSLDDWAKHLAMEISQKHKGSETKAVDDLSETMKARMGGASSKGDVIDRLVDKVKFQLSEE